MRHTGSDATNDNDWRVTARLRDLSTAGTAMHAVCEWQEALSSVRVGNDGVGTVYLYANSRDAAESARDALRALFDRRSVAADVVTERWHPLEEDWEQADKPMPQTAEERSAEWARRQPSRGPGGFGGSHRRPRGHALRQRWRGGRQSAGWV